MAEKRASDVDIVTALALASTSPQAVNLVVSERQAQRRAAEAKSAEESRQQAAIALKQSEIAAADRRQVRQQEFQAAEGEKARAAAATEREKDRAASESRFSRNLQQQQQSTAAAQATRDNALFDQVLTSAREDLIRFNEPLGGKGGAGVDRGAIVRALMQSPGGQQALLTGDPQQIQQFVSEPANALFEQLAQASGQSSDNVKAAFAGLIKARLSRVPDHMKVDMLNALASFESPAQRAVEKMNANAFTDITGEEFEGLSTQVAAEWSQQLIQGVRPNAAAQSVMRKLLTSPDITDEQRGDVFQKTFNSILLARAQEEGFDDERTNTLLEAGHAALRQALEIDDFGGLSDFINPRQPEPFEDPVAQTATAIKKREQRKARSRGREFRLGPGGAPVTLRGSFGGD